MNTRIALILSLLTLPILPASAQAAAKAAEALLSATSPYEDLIDSALAANDQGISKSMAAADQQSPSVKAMMPQASAVEFARLLNNLHGAASQNDYQRIAVDAVDIYRMILDNVTPQGLVVPKEVDLLDYAGFKARVSAAAGHTDWPGLQKTADDASRWWQNIQGKVSEEALRDAFSATVTGLQNASRDKDVRMLNLAAQIDLDLVDMLENYFSKRAAHGAEARQQAQ